MSWIKKGLYSDLPYVPHISALISVEFISGVRVGFEFSEAAFVGYPPHIPHIRRK